MGQWQILPPKPPLGPLDQILDDLERALTAKFYYLAIMIALALPDICACLESPNGNTRGRVGEAYKDWFRANLSNRFNNLTDVDAYQLRCGVMHQGHFGDHPRRNYDRIIFIGQNPNIRYRADIVVTISPDVAFGGMSVEELRLSGRILHLEAEFFCRTISDAVRTWAIAKADDPNVKTNLPKLVRYRPYGMPPYIVGVPLIA
jgi:hypothetical protein